LQLLLGRYTMYDFPHKFMFRYIKQLEGFNLIEGSYTFDYGIDILYFLLACLVSFNCGD